MIKPCSEQMPMARKIQRYLSCCFRIYRVSEARYQPVINQVLAMDLHPAAQQTVDRIMALVEAGFTSAMDESGSAFCILHIYAPHCSSASASFSAARCTSSREVARFRRTKVRKRSPPNQSP